MFAIALKNSYPFADPNGEKFVKISSLPLPDLNDIYTLKKHGIIEATKGYRKRTGASLAQSQHMILTCSRLLDSL